MNKTLRLLSMVFAAVMILCTAFSVSAKAEGDYGYLIDDGADLLTDAEENELYDAMLPICEYGNVMFVTTDYDPYGTVEDFADAYYHDVIGTDSGMLFVIDMDKRKICIFCDGYVYQVINKNKANTITDNVYGYASDGDYLGCASEAYRQAATLLSGGRISEPMRYITSVLVAIMIALVLNFMIVLSASKAKAVSLNEVKSSSTGSFNARGAVSRLVDTIRIYSPQSKGNGGSGGGGGGHSGGGGSHSF